MVQPIRIDGLVSGLDTTSIVNKLMALERLPLLSMQSRQQKLQLQISALNTIKASIFALQTRATDLTRSSTFSAMKATSSNEQVAAATAMNGSASASYLVDITSLATADRYTSAALAFNDALKATMQSTGELNTTPGVDANPNAAFNSGLTNLESAVTAGSFYVNNTRIDVLETDTINTVLNKITASTANVTAAYDVNTDTITLTQKTGGETPTITLSGDTSGFLDAAKLSAATVNPGENADENKLLKDTYLDAALTDGYFSINGTFFSVDKNTDSLMSIINKINSSTTAGVTAFYDANSKTVSINSKTAGASGNIAFGTGATDTSNFLSAINITNTHEAGADALVTVNGTAVQPVDNKISINGATITLKSAGTTTITVQSDIDKAVEAVKAFIEQYNKTMSDLNSKLTEQPLQDPQTDAERQTGILYGNSLLRNMAVSIRRSISTAVTGLSASISQLSQIGITTGAVGSSVSTAIQGTLVLDEEKLRSALTTNVQAVAAMLGNGTAAVAGEAVGTGDGSTITFNLANKPVAFAPAPTITVGGVTYKMVSGTPSSDPADREYKLNFLTGEITFGAAPAAGQAIVANYNYSINTGSQAGIMVQLASKLGAFTTVGGTFDASIGSNGSLTRRVSDLNKQMESLQRRLDLREEGYYRQFAAMERALSIMKSQSDWLNGQLASLTAFQSNSRS